MKKNHPLEGLVAGSALGFILAMLIGGATVSCGATFADEPTEVLLARLCVNEATWNTIDCAAIGHVRLRTARHNGRTLREELIAQHGNVSLREDRAFSLQAGDVRPWIGDLSSDSHRPEGFADDGSWEATYRNRWEDVLRVASEVVGGTRRDPCAERGGRPVTWGGRTVDADSIARLQRSGFRAAYCGATFNEYLERSRNR